MMLVNSNKEQPFTFTQDLHGVVETLKSWQPFKFNESIDLAITLYEEKNKKKKNTRNIKGQLVLPHSIVNKDVKIGVFTDNKEEAMGAGAHVAGLDDLIHKIKEENIIDCDYYVAKKKFIGKIASLGMKLGSRGLMPSPKNGTITDDIVGICKKLKAGVVNYRENNNLLHFKIGNINLENNKIYENILHSLKEIYANHHNNISKKRFFENLHFSTTMKNKSISVKLS